MKNPSKMGAKSLSVFIPILLIASLGQSDGINLAGLNPFRAVGKVIDTVKNDTIQTVETVKDIKPVQVIGTVKNDTMQTIETVKNSEPVQVIEAVKDKVLSPSEYLDDIANHMPSPVDIVGNVSELVKTTAVYTRNNESLNCLGLPLKSVEKALEKIFVTPTKAQDIKYYFSTRRLKNYVTFHAGEGFTFDQIDFDPKRPTVLVVHGFMSSGREAWCKNMKNAFLELDDVNTIVVDWQEGSNTWNYYSAAISTRVVGLQIAKLFARLREAIDNKGNGISVNELGPIYFVGHSLGAHISAYASYLIKESQKNEQKSWIVSRITGLDPAQPCFSTADPSLKLDKSDAPYVDIIHTNARHRLLLGLGLPEQLGYVDFYPNGGKAQPGCADIDTSIWTIPLLPIELIKESVCSHGRSHAFLTESIIDLAYNNCSFYGFQWDRKALYRGRAITEECNNTVCTEMGVSSLNYYPNDRGIFFVPTSDTAPFCQNNGNVKHLGMNVTNRGRVLRINPQSN